MVICGTDRLQRRNQATFLSQLSFRMHLKGNRDLNGLSVQFQTNHAPTPIRPRPACPENDRHHNQKRRQDQRQAAEIDRLTNAVRESQASEKLAIARMEAAVTHAAAAPTSELSRHLFYLKGRASRDETTEPKHWVGCAIPPKPPVFL
jgi:hypothetical protein